jgi:putative ABC transport system permease protein
VIQFRLPAGDRIDLTVDAVSDDTTVFGPPWILHQETYAAEFDEVLDFQVMATVAEGADVDAVIGDVEAAVDGFPSIDVLDREGFEGDLVAQLQSFVNFIYGLLALSIIIAMIGVANTISLSVHERTRELGLLRAVGMTRAQLRSSIRWEAVLISVLGAGVGVALGLLSSYALVKALGGFGLTSFGVPVPTLAGFVVGLAALGVIASLLPARRAARLDVLKAIGTD